MTPDMVNAATIGLALGFAARCWWLERRLRVLGEAAWRMKTALEERGVHVEAEE